jgi:hypothetical protein
MRLRVYQQTALITLALITLMMARRKVGGRMNRPIPERVTVPTVIVFAMWIGLWLLYHAGEISEARAMWSTVCLFVGYFCGFLNGDRAKKGQVRD